MTFPALLPATEYVSQSAQALLFYTSVDSLGANAETLAAQWFDAEEQHRLQQFRFERDRRLFLASHLMMRHILGHYTGTEPAKLEFVKNRHGKPMLNLPYDVHFSLSHSGRLALLGVSRCRDIGVDVEEADLNHPLDGALLRFFSANEQNHFRKLDASAQKNHFYELWTLKESVVKATGRGLSQPFDQFSVVIDDSGDVTLEAHSNEMGPNKNWALARLALPTESTLASAVALRRDNRADSALDCQSYWVDLRDFSMAPTQTSNPGSVIQSPGSDLRLWLHKV